MWLKGKADKAEIAEVLATFYENLCTSRRNGDPAQIHGPSSSDTIPHFTAEELDKAIKETKQGKAGDEHGVRAELFKVDRPPLGQIIG